MNKVVIFDWGGIVENHENNLEELDKAKIRLIKRFNNDLSEQEILDKWTDKTSKGVLISVINDKNDIKDWITCLNKKLDIKVSFRTFKRAYEEEFSKISYYKDVAKYFHFLKDRCNVVILSNLGPFDKKRMYKQYNLSKFDKVYLSFELGMRKPDREIYEYVTKDLGVTPENILFIDDNKENITMAKFCGWNTCRAYGYELDKIRNSVEEFLK